MIKYIRNFFGLPRYYLLGWGDYIIMKKIIKTATLLCIILLLTSCGKNAVGFSIPPYKAESPMTAGTSIINPDSEVRGVWIATIFNIDYPSYYDLPADKLKAEIDDIIETCKETGLNTVFFQVRPSCDALYDSDIFPVSRVLSTTGKLQFDPLDYFVKEAHKNNIFLHAWINPLRITTSANSEDKLSDKSPAKLHPEWTVKYADGKLYFNAGLPEVRDLVADGVREVVEKYDVDGVVFDDYFYPYPSGGADFDDGAAYEKYGSGYASKADWRRNNINELIKLCYDTVKETDPECLFGVAPGGVWQNNNGSNGGSDTRGFETYHSLYCDSVAWIRGGYIDYISPQIYWRFDSATTPFAHLAEWWNAQTDGTDVQLWISHGVYFYDSAESGAWKSPSGEIKSQIEYARNILSYRGSMFYGYDEVRGNDFGLADELREAYRDEIIYCDPASSGVGLIVTSHYYGQECATGKAEVQGVSDPSVGLTCNGRGVSRNKDGSFSLEVNIVKGENKLEFVHGGEKYTLIINGK